MLFEFNKQVIRLPFGNCTSFFTSGSSLCIVSMCLDNLITNFSQNGQHNFFADLSDVSMYISRVSQPNSLLGLMVSDSASAVESTLLSTRTWKLINKDIQKETRTFLHDQTLIITRNNDTTEPLINTFCGPGLNKHECRLKNVERG